MAALTAGNIYGRSPACSRDHESVVSVSGRGCKNVTMHTAQSFLRGEKDCKKAVLSRVAHAVPRKHLPVQCCSALSLPFNHSTFSSENESWVGQEFENLLSMKAEREDMLLMTRGRWRWNVAQEQKHILTGEMIFYNLRSNREVFVLELEPSVVLLSNGSLDGIDASAKITAGVGAEGKELVRADGYWPGYIIEAKKSLTIQVTVSIAAGGASNLHELTAARVKVQYVSYGAHGWTRKSQYVILPLNCPPPAPAEQPPKWKMLEGGLQVLPIPTHLLCHHDDPLSVMKRYVLEYAQPGDVLAMGESPLAIMQGRFRHPSSIRVSWLARIACRAFKTTSSLATACGMQSLIDLLGKPRIILALVLGAIFRILQIRGMFYRVAGEQSRLVDDTTGTLVPYDQFITLGPVKSQEICDDLKAKTGCHVAIVDVNDLKKVDILGASKGSNREDITAALRGNPAGNSNEQTPLVLIRRASIDA